MSLKWLSSFCIKLDIGLHILSITFCRISGISIALIFHLMFPFNSSTVCGLVGEHFKFEKPYKKKSAGFKSGKCVGQTISPLQEIQNLIQINSKLQWFGIQHHKLCLIRYVCVCSLYIIQARWRQMPYGAYLNGCFQVNDSKSSDFTQWFNYVDHIHHIQCHLIYFCVFF